MASQSPFSSSSPSAISSSRPSPGEIGECLRRLEAGRQALEALPTERLEAAWCGAIEDALGPPGASLRDQMASNLRLSPCGLAAGLAVVLEGAQSNDALRLLATARRAGPGPALAILAANVPGLAVQVLLPALALRRPLFVKSSSREPHFARFFVDALARRESVLGETLAAAAWPGGDAARDRAALDAASRVVAYGADASLRAIQSRMASTRAVERGEVVSCAVVAATDIARDVDGLARAIARDTALFDQRGCLSPQWIFVETPTPSTASPAALRLAEALAKALDDLAIDLPPGPLDTASAAAVRALRDEAILFGSPVFTAERIDRGTVLVDATTPLAPGPGSRTLRVVPSALDEIPARLAPTWQGRLQGVALSQGARHFAGSLKTGAGRGAKHFAGSVPGTSREPVLRTSSTGARHFADSSETGARHFAEPSETGARHFTEPLTGPLAASFEALGATWICPLGELQNPPLAAWRNGGLDPLDALA